MTITAGGFRLVNQSRVNVSAERTLTIITIIYYYLRVLQYHWYVHLNRV